VVQVPPRKPNEPLRDGGDVPPIGPNPAIRRTWGRFEERELRWWVAVLVAAVVLSLLAVYAVH